ncbi:hypothetical protein D5R93_07595 [Actinomyces lilanjuaniae]|uniref:Uncharacterized protein n=1 Tax=Actinomyces lilanjuaniae TaxID=2321394 RepID=A0ABN5PNG9_9ACTO|nr:DUF6668 family protein [Actinomyces lilanjuaniae]AYD89923.1 hypothetical protein D5R93_07595 [Actinomyces lilanjuaniae]
MPTATTATNPWLAAEDTTPEEAAPEPTPQAAPALTGPAAPQAGVPAPAEDQRLPVVTVRDEASLWVVGAHGGSAESTIAALSESWRATSHRWPVPAAEAPVRAVLTARLSVSGIQAAQGALTQWACGLVPGVKLLGLVLVADAPGRVPRPVRDLAQVVGGGAPRTWQVPWIRTWRLGEPPDLGGSPRAARTLVKDLVALCDKEITNREDRA